MPAKASVDKFFFIRCLRFLRLSRATLTVCPSAHAPLLRSSPPRHCVHNCVVRPFLRDVSPKKYHKPNDALKYEFKVEARKCHGNLQKVKVRRGETFIVCLRWHATRISIHHTPFGSTVYQVVFLYITRRRQRSGRSRGGIPYESIQRRGRG